MRRRFKRAFIAFFDDDPPSPPPPPQPPVAPAAPTPALPYILPNIQFFMGNLNAGANGSHSQPQPTVTMVQQHGISSQSQGPPPSSHSGAPPTAAQAAPPQEQSIATREPSRSPPTAVQDSTSNVHNAQHRQPSPASTNVQSAGAAAGSQQATSSAGSMADGARGAAVSITAVNVAVSSQSKESWEYPDGDTKREYVKGTEPSNYKETKWAYRSMGGKGKKSGISRKICLGVWMCASNCGTPLRPKTDKEKRDLQGEETCPTCGNTGYTRFRCDAIVSWYEEVREDGETWVVWEHTGTHNHPKPAANRLTQSERQDVVDQVKRRPTASALEHRTGDTTPGSVPLGQISQVLNNPNSSRYYVKDARASIGITPSPTVKGGEVSFLKDIMRLNTELGEEFIIDTGLFPQGYLVLCTPWMRSVLEKTLDEWVEGSALVYGRRGFVTDGNHSFFKEDTVLLTTCAFSRVLKAWAPVLYTVILGEDEEHHRPHFRNLFMPIIRKAEEKGIKFEKKFLLNVMDFSQAQRNAHAIEYANAAIQTIPGHAQWEADVRELQLQHLREEAKGAEIGCQFHFQEMATRIKSDSGLVDPARVEDFNSILRKLLSPKTTDNKFGHATLRMHKEFPDAFKWLSWWLRASHIGMIFPSMSPVEPSVREEAPSTSNAVEHIHSLLNQAVGKHHTLLDGIKSIHRFVKKFESEEGAVQGGYYTPSGPRDKRAPKTVKFIDNDGRGPDTAAAIQGLQPLATLGVRMLALPLFALAYQWNKVNSCFIDHGQELAFREYCMWDTDTRTRCRALLSTESFLFKAFEHYDFRLKLLTGAKKKNSETQRRLLDAMLNHQKATLELFFSKWHPNLNRKAYHCAMLWLQPSLEDGDTSPEVHEFFCLSIMVEYTCPDGHPDIVRCTTKPAAVLPISSHLLNRLIAAYNGQPIGIGTYLSQQPFLSPWSTLHPDLFKTRQCSSSSCGHGTCSCLEIVFRWPRRLTIESSSRKSAGNTGKLVFDSRMVITDARGAEVVYILVGRILHQSGNHYVAELSLAGSVYKYDDIPKGTSTLATLRKVPTGTDPFAKRSSSEVYYVYHRVSEAFETRQMSKVMQEKFKDLQNNGGTPANPLDYTHLPTSDKKASSSKGKSSKTKPLVNPPVASASKAFRTIDSLPESGAASSEEEALVKSTAARFKQRGPTVTHISVTNTVTVPTRARSIPSCFACGVQGAAAKITVQCHMCKSNWHTACVRRYVPPGIDLSLPEEFAFCCPQCIFPVNGRWDQLMLDSFLLLDVNQVLGRAGKESMFYPACVASREDDVVFLHWHTHIDWPGKSPVVNQHFTMTPQECYSARCRDLFQDLGGRRVEGTRTVAGLGTIRWPLELHEIDSEEDRQAVESWDTLEIVDALKSAVPAVLEVIQWSRLHPILDLMEDHMRNAPKHGLARQNHAIGFRKSFSLPLFPAHRALAEYHATNLHGNVVGAAGSSAEPIDATYSPENTVCASILLELVVLRQYLKLGPECDAEVYEVARVLDEAEYMGLQDSEVAMRARVVRKLTVHERAFASCRTASDLLQLKKAVDRTCEISAENPHDLTSVISEDGTPYEFGSYQHKQKREMTLIGQLYKPAPRIIEPPSSTPREFPLKNLLEGSLEPEVGPEKTPLKITIPPLAKTKKPAVQTTLPFEPRRRTRSTTQQDGVGESVDRSPPAKRTRRKK